MPEESSFVKMLLEAAGHLDQASFGGTCIDQVTGETEHAQGYTSPAGLVLRTKSGRTVMLPPAVVLELLDSVTAITMSTIMRDFLTNDLSDEERSYMAQALFDAAERMVATKTHLQLTFDSPIMVAAAYKRARAEHTAHHHNHDEEED